MDLSFRNRAVLDLPMRMAQHDATNKLMLDVSPSEDHAIFGNGADPGTYPTKLDYRRGYNFNGVGNYCSFSTVNPIEETDNETIFFVMSNLSNSSSYIYSTRDGGSGGTGIFVRAASTLSVWVGLTEDLISTRVIDRGLVSGCVVRKGTTSIQLYINGEFDSEDLTIVGPYTDGTARFIGARGDGAGGIALPLAADLHALMVFDYALTPLQIEDLHLTLTRKSIAGV